MPHRARAHAARLPARESLNVRTRGHWIAPSHATPTVPLRFAELICELLGTPADEARQISPYAGTMLDSLNLSNADPERQNWSTRFAGATSTSIDLLRKMLQFHPKDRCTANDALQHSYLSAFHDKFVEREAPVCVSVSIPDGEKRSTNHYRERLYKEVEQFRKLEKKLEGMQPRATGTA